MFFDKGRNCTYWTAGQKFIDVVMEAVTSVTKLAKIRHFGKILQVIGIFLNLF